MSKKGVCVHGENNSHQLTREQLVTAMLEGQTWQQVSTGFPVPLKRAMAYRLLRAVRAKGNIARPRWATRTSIETAWRGTSLSRSILSRGSLHTELRSPNLAPRTLWSERE